MNVIDGGHAQAEAQGDHLKGRISTFVLLTGLLSAPLWWLHYVTHSGVYTGLLMWCPGVAALISVKLVGGSMSDLGWRASNLKWVALGWLLTVVGLTAAYVAVWCLGLAQFPDPKFVQDTAAQIGMKGMSPSAVLVVLTILSAVAAPINAIGRALGEELGWRGYFVPRACARYGFVPGALVVGMVWALWHLPFLWGNLSLLQFANFFVLVVGISVVYAWLRLRSNSVWPSTIMHATHNAFRDWILNGAFVVTAGNSNWFDEGGYSLAVMGILLGVIFALLPKPFDK